MKRVALYTNVVSPHQLPLAREIAKLVGEDNFRYIYTQDDDKDHSDLGWRNEVPEWCVNANDVQAHEWLETADVLLSGLREFDLFERRAAKGLKNFYMTERWFKPPIGIFRLLHPRYFGYARGLCRMMAEGSLVGFPIGIHAASDMARLCGLMHCDLRCLFRAPKLDFESKPGGRIFLSSHTLPLPATAKSPLQLPTTTTTKFCLDKMRMWGYFVEPSQLPHSQLPQSKLTHSPTPNSPTIKVLWVGRFLKLKRVDTIIRAVGELSKSQSPSNSNFQLQLDIYGTGPEEKRLKKLASKYGDVIKFYPPVPITDVRRLMREHDVYVLSSNAYEGWGAVVSEALEEGMKVIGAYEAGSSATILPESNLFHSGDWKGLLKLLQKDIPRVSIGDWSARKAVEVIDA